MGLLSEQDLATLAQTPPEPVELPFWEGAAAVLESGRLTDQSFSTHYQTSDAIRAAFDAMSDHGLGQYELAWPVLDVTAENALALLDSRADEIRAARGGIEGPPDLRLRTGEEIRGAIAERVAAARADAERAGLGAQLVGGLGVGITDPVNIAMIPPGAAAGEALLVKALVEAGIGMASQAAVEAASVGAKERAGVEPSLANSAANVALTGVLGAGMVGVFHGAGLLARRTGIVDAYRAAVAEGRIAPDAALDDAADAVADAAEVVRPLDTPEAEAASLDAVAAAADLLRAETPDAETAAAMRFARRANAAAQPEVAIPAEALPPDRSRIDATVQAALEAPRTPDAPFIATDPAPPQRLTTDVEEAAFVAATEADPEVTGSYVAGDGTERVGRATDLVAELDDEGTTLRGILDCVLAGGPPEATA